MLTNAEEYEYYMSLYEQSLDLGKRDSDYLIIAERFKAKAESFKEKDNELS